VAADAMSLSSTAQELAWLYVAEHTLVGSVRDFAVFLGRSEAEITAAVVELARFGCIVLDRDDSAPGASTITFEETGEDARRALTAALRAMGPSGDAPRLRSTFGYSPVLVGRDPRMHDVYATIERVSHTNATVLLLGESGVGKEVVARTIHAESLRADRPLVVIDCAAIPPSLLESELFGHERGAFTSAVTTRIGKFEEADGGTVFLDEIGELPLDLQAKLLRVLQTRQFSRIGRPVPVSVDVRFIASTNVDLEKRVREGTFRDDLFYRLNVVTVRIPPLRERRADIPLLVQRIVATLSRRNGVSPRWLEPEALARLAAYTWPGNVRELENVLERALILARGPMITAEDLALPDIAEAGGIQRPEPLRTLREVEMQHIRRVLTVTDGNESRAARILGIHRDTLSRKLRRVRGPLNGLSRGTRDAG
jgi:DNA-binding NtrC family response regulator